jgi:1-phosphofructokinase
MIVTVTPNPSLDRTLEVEALARGSVVRATSVRIDPGGKGINVSLALTATGHSTRAVVPLGGHEGDQLAEAITEAGIDLAAVHIDQPVRTNISLTEPDGTVTKINDPGPRLSLDQADELRAATVSAVKEARWLAACGSLPPGAPEGFYADLVVEAHAAGARVVVDASGAPLAAAVKVGPDLIKPNVHELAELTGRRLRRLGDVVDAADSVRAQGVAIVVVSLGADGAVLVNREGAWHATTPPIVVRSAVGAGDAMVAGLLAAGGDGPEALRNGVAYGAGAAQLPGTQFPRTHDVDAVTVSDVDPDRELTEQGGSR